MEPLMNAMRQSMPLVMGTGGVGLALYGAYKYGDTALPYYNVIGGQRAVEYNRISGVNMEVKSEGMHFKAPWFTRPTIFNVKYEPYMLRSWSGSRDLQMVDIALRVLCRPDPQRLPAIFKNIGADYKEKVLPSIVNEVLKSEVAKYNATQLITNREQISREIKDLLKVRAREYGLEIQDVSLTHLQFSDVYAKAVEEKQVAQQEAERAKYIVQKAEEEAKSIKIKASGEAQAASEIGDAMRDNPGFLQLRRIEAAQVIAKTMVHSQNKVFLDAGTLLLNLGDHETGMEKESAKKKR